MSKKNRNFKKVEELKETTEAIETEEEKNSEETPENEEEAEKPKKSFLKKWGPVFGIGAGVALIALIGSKFGRNDDAALALLEKECGGEDSDEDDESEEDDDETDEVKVTEF